VVRRRDLLRYSLTFLMLAVALVVIALNTWAYTARGAILLFYAATSFALLAVAYAGAGPGILLKRATGRRSVLSWLLFAPYFLLSAATFGLYRLLTREPAYVQVAPNLFFGRRLSASEAGAIGWVSVLDLAAEFPAARWERTRPAYRSLPVLDSAVPSEEELRSVAAWIGESISPGPLYVHCALGHGRSACVVIAYLLSVGTVGTVAEGVQRLQSLRPGVRLNTSQVRLLRRFEPPANGQGAESGTVRCQGGADQGQRNL
jgi:protein-tyrosine phosphatase